MIPLKKKSIHKLWKKWTVVSNFIYNATLNLLRKHPFLKKECWKYRIRDAIKEYYKSIINKYHVPNTTVEYSVFQAIQAFNQSKNAVNRTRKQNHFSIKIDGRSIKNGVIYPNNTKRFLKDSIPNYKKNRQNLLKNLPIKKLIGIQSNRVCDLIYKKDIGKFYLAIPVKREKQNTIELNNLNNRETIALDPGLRSFLAFYDMESYGEIGKDLYIRIKQLNKKQNKIDSKIAKMKKTKKNYYKKVNLKKRKARISNKIKNIVNDLHNKTCNFLTKYKYILLPEFKVKPLVLKMKHKASRRALLDLAHFKFKMKLIQKASETGSKIIICNEAYTSKTCTGCGFINYKLGSKKTFKCPDCHLIIDRDVNGARNIFLRVLSKSLL